MLQLALEGTYGGHASEADCAADALREIENAETPFDLVIAGNQAFGPPLLAFRAQQPNAIRSMILWKDDQEAAINLANDQKNVEIFDSSQTIDALFAAIGRVRFANSPDPSTGRARFFLSEHRRHIKCDFLRCPITDDLSFVQG